MKKTAAIAGAAAFFCFISHSVVAAEEKGVLPAEATPLPKEAQELAAKAAALRSYRAEFQLEAKEETGETVRLAGALLFQRPNQRRLELRQEGSAEPSQLLVSDGKVEWQYAPAEKKAYRLESALEAPGPHRPFAEGASFRFVGKVRTEGGPCLRFEGMPLPAIVADSPVPIKTLRVDVGQEDGLVRELALLDAGAEAVLSQKYSRVEADVEVPEGSFSFSPPEGVSVEDLS